VSGDAAAPLTVLVQAEGHPRILERLLAVVASRSFTLTGVRSFRLAEEPAPWLLLTVHGLPTRAHALIERMASLPHVLTLARVAEIDRPTAPVPPDVSVELLGSGFRVRIGERFEDATTPEVAVARLLAPSAATSLGVLMDAVADGVRVIGCCRTRAGVRAAGATAPDGVAAALTVFNALALPSVPMASHGADEMLALVP
jgi:hypothetical protein